MPHASGQVVVSYQRICERAKGIEKAGNTLRHEMGVMHGKGPAKMSRGHGVEGAYTAMYLQRRILSREETRQERAERLGRL